MDDTMNDTWLKIKVWTKVAIIALIVLFLVIFTYKNYSYPVTVWLFRDHTMTVLELLVSTFLIGVIATLLARPTYHTLGQIAELRKPKPEPIQIVTPMPAPAPDPIKPQP